MSKQIIHIDGLSSNEAMNLLGTNDNNLNIIAECFDTPITFRNEDFILLDADESVFRDVNDVIMALYDLARKGQHITDQDVIYACRLINKNARINLETLNKQIIGRTMSGKVIAPKTNGQKQFLDAMENYSIVFAIGPAGTGKTYLAVVEAVAQLKRGNVKRIVLTRPAVEAGESLGFLPGDLKEKIDPYLTPLYDALHDMLGNEQTDKLIEKGIIEIAPLAYMRGRTLDDAFIILDEAQNTTPMQMKMFLTRLGFNSHMVITGDITQIDLNGKMTSGLLDASQVLHNIKEIKILKLSSDDVVRHPLVQKIIESYELAKKEG